MEEIFGLSVWLFAIFVALSVLTIFAVVFLALMFYFRRYVGKVGQRWRDEGLELVKGPIGGNYRGHESMAIPARGNGVLALTPDDVRFAQLMPTREYVVPLDQITGVEIHRAWHGSYRAGVPVIVIRIQPPGLDADALGLAVSPAEEWAAAIAKAADVPLRDTRNTSG